MRKSILILAAALLWTIPAAADETVRTFSQQLPTEDIRKVALDFPVGEIAVDAWDSQGLQLDVRLECHRASGSCRESAQKVRLVYSTKDGELHVEIKSWPKLSGHGLEAHVHVHMPRDLPLNADLGVGEMRLTGFTGDVRANVGVGELILTLPASAVSSVNADTGIGEANLTAAGHHYQSAGLFTKELRWNKGTGASKVSADCGVGEINVRLE
jgi:hypothetical protein